MHALKAILGLLAIFIALPLLIVWLNDRIFRRPLSRVKRDEVSRQFVERLRHPDFSTVEAHFGCVLPEEIKRFYLDQEKIMQMDFQVLVKSSKNSDGGAFYVAYFMPADSQSLADMANDGRQYFAFAGDGCGDQFLVDLGDPSLTVILNDHETGEFCDLGITFGEFLSAPRKTPV